MNSQLFIMLFSVGYRIMKSNLKDIDHSQSLYIPEKGGNCINWMLGHILLSRIDLLKIFGSGFKLGFENTDKYKRGSRGRDIKSLQDFGDLLKDLEKSQNILIDNLKNINNEFLDQTITQADNTQTSRANEIAFYHLHETYHTGQIGLLRRISGLEGVIK